MRLAFASLVFVAGCLEAGERAASCPDGDTSCTTTCPAGETCSPDTPNGLYFGGATTCNSAYAGGPMATAVGGTQTIVIDGLGILPFTVAVDGDAFTAMAGAGGTVAVTGVADGTAELRILDPGTGELYDRIALDVATAESAQVSSCTTLWGDGEPTHVLWFDSTALLAVELVGGGTVLADQTMTIALPAGSNPYSWDSFAPSVPLATGTLAVETTLTDGTPLTATAGVVDHADAVTYAATLGEPLSDGLAVGDTGLYAFAATSAGAGIMDVPFTTATDAPLSVGPYAVTGDFVSVDAVAVGDGHLTVSAGGAHATFEIPVIAAKAAAPTPHPLDAPRPAHAAGERARMHAAD